MQTVYQKSLLQSLWKACDTSAGQLWFALDSYHVEAIHAQVAARRLVYLIHSSTVSFGAYIGIYDGGNLTTSEIIAASPLNSVHLIDTCSRATLRPCSEHP